jgi:hypothetical protein
VGELVFKFQKPLGVSGASCVIQYRVVDFKALLCTSLYTELGVPLKSNMYFEAGIKVPNFKTYYAKLERKWTFQSMYLKETAMGYVS